jgi:hypothetical protein
MDIVLIALPWVIGGIWGVYCAHKRYGLLVLLVGCVAGGVAVGLLKIFIRSLL